MRLVNALCSPALCLIPEWLVILISAIALITSLYYLTSQHKAGALIFTVAVTNFIIAYAWIAFTDPRLLERATVIRFAVAYLMAGIAWFCYRESNMGDGVRALIKKITQRLRE